MSRLKKASKGRPLVVKHRAVRFSFWPMYRKHRRYGLQSLIFASSPWQILRQKIQNKCLKKTQSKALAFVDQAEDYYKAASSSLASATKPVLYYYCFLNLAKAHILLTKTKENLEKAKHGISEFLPQGGNELVDAKLEVFKATSSTNNIFDLFSKSLTGAGIGKKKLKLEVRHLLPQVLQGHRVWCSINSETERFISLDTIQILHDANTKHLWLAVYLPADDLSRLGVSRKRLLERSGISSMFAEVEYNKPRYGSRILKFEQDKTVSYTGRPSDKVQDTVNKLKKHLWSNVLSVPPYRKYYLYMAPEDEQYSVLPQLLSIYSIFYYLGSVTRYRPDKYSELMSGEYAAQLYEILENIPTQFLYLLASEYSCQEVTRAAIV